MELCVELKKGKMAKEGLTQFKNLCQNVNIQSLENVVKKFMDLAEEKIKEAHLKINLDQIEDLEMENPDAGSLLTSESLSVEKVDRDGLASGFRFLWETYRTVLDVLRNNSKLEILYQSTCVHAFDFCVKYSRPTEFRRLCEVLRGHFNSIMKYTQQQHSINLNIPESFLIQLEIRFHQLNAAVNLKLWQETFRSIEDIHGLLNLSKRPIRSSLLANYFEKLALVFLVGENHLFHAAALNKLFTLLKNHPKMAEKEKLEEIAEKNLVASLVIPIIGTNPLVSSLDEDETNEKVSKLSSIVGISSVPTRDSLLKDALSKSSLNYLNPRFLELYNVIEVEFHPLSICNKVGSFLLEMDTKEHLKPYIKALYNVAMTRFIQQISQVYSTITLDQLNNLSKAPVIDELNKFSIERFIMNGCHSGVFNVRIDHRSKSVSFQSNTDLNVGLTELSKKLSQASLLNHDLQKIRSEEIATYVSNFEKEHQAILGRKAIIEEKKEILESFLMKKEKEEAKERAARQHQEQEAERIRLLEESKKREMERMKRDMEEIGRQEARKLAESIKKEMEASGKKLEIENVENLGKQELLMKQMEQIDREKKEMEARLKLVARKMDHLERALRKEEKEFVLQDYEKQKEQDKITHKLIVEQEHNKAKKMHERNLKVKERFEAFASDMEEFRTQLLKQRTVAFEKEKEEKQKELEKEKEKRIAQIRQKAEEERKAKEAIRLREIQEEERRKELLKEKEDEERRLAAEKAAQISGKRTILPLKEGGWRSRLNQNPK